MKRILVIDDDKDIAELVQTILADNYEVACKADSHGIVDHLKNFDPHLILLDNGLGDRSSKDVIDEIRSVTDLKRVPVVLFSAHHQIDKIAADVKADGYLSKPFSLIELQAMLDKYIAL